MIKEAPIEVKKMINDYRSLNFNGIEVVTPYFRNVKRVRAELRVLAGKGTPEEIAEETLIYAKLRGFSFSNSNSNQIREFMQDQGIGVDCSGFVSHVLNAWSKAVGLGNLSSHVAFPPSTFYRSIVRKFRFFENIGADILTSDRNCEKIEIKNVQPGDLIRLKGLTGGHHIAIVTRVETNEEGLPITFIYSHSSEQYGEENGIRSGEVKILNVHDGLKDQEWLEKDPAGKCWTYEQLLKEYEDNGLRRPKFFIKS